MFQDILQLQPYGKRFILREHIKHSLHIIWRKQIDFKQPLNLLNRYQNKETFHESFIINKQTRKSITGPLLIISNYEHFQGSSNHCELCS